ncbi:hypothetical protein Pmani_028543 [Petrolisthes manimaculis]|uniref:Lipase domain-containing protein n=1 Tax=Petrolisthes manimaculis TaxID=1843537 RepID=A0AAE1TVL0_9EUCA|nr:hypothetical protein Pmani_028543 [Petrolisthes manimaculis]
MNGKQMVLGAVAVAVVAFLAIKVYPNFPSGRLGVLFYFTASSHDERQEFQATKEGIMTLALDASTPINVIIHGYTESSIRPWVVNLTNALLSRDPSSVVMLVDYYDLTTISRPYMMENARNIAQSTAHLLDLLVKNQGIKLSNIHIMGFSLGGRISGLVGARVKTGKIGRITGIDASYPWLPPVTNEEYLDAEDATLVVNLRTSLIGSRSPPAHVDFYANGGTVQPGCQKWYYFGPVQEVCNHYLSVKLMTEAVENSDKIIFPACKCPNWESFHNNTCTCEVINHFGLNTDPSIRGSFYFRTNMEPPYSRPLD